MKTNMLDPHAGGRVLHVGPEVGRADVVLIMVHGRGASAESILGLYDELGVEGAAAIAPEAAGNTWYPLSFLAPMGQNQPYLDSALKRIETLVKELEGRGVSLERIALLGFSQGACLVSEFAARHPRRYAGVMALTGGLIGPPGTPRDYPGSLAGTPVFIGSGDPDMHVPFERVEETREVLERMGARVDMRRYPGMPHTVNEEEVEACRQILRGAVAAGRKNVGEMR